MSEWMGNSNHNHESIETKQDKHRKTKQKIKYLCVYVFMGVLIQFVLSLPIKPFIHIPVMINPLLADKLETDSMTTDRSVHMLP